MEKIYEDVEDLLRFIKEEMDKMGIDAEEAFLNGDCGNLYKIFVSKFPKLTTPFLIRYKDEPMHIITRIGEKFYDITGETSLEKYAKRIREINYCVIEKYEDKDFELERLSVADRLLDKMCDMYKYNDDYEQSEIDSQMHQLLRLLKNRDASQR